MDDREAIGRSQAILLLKFPRKGEVKARLARQLGEDLVVDLYRNFILDMLSTLEVLGVRHAISYFPPGSLDPLSEWLSRPLSYHPQRGRDHPERLMNTFIDAFSRGEERVLVLASDVPDITPAVIAEACASLEQKDAVLGPSPDGGYYLIGFRREVFREGAFRGIAWSTERAFSDTMSRLNGLSVHLLPLWPDVDTASDLQTLTRSGRNPAFSSSRTMAFLRDRGLAGR
jgi:rSAM/selenodomain-associated transferase 1